MNECHRNKCITRQEEDQEIRDCQRQWERDHVINPLDDPEEDQEERARRRVWELKRRW